jgi:DNA repair exonuclease SbcCD ATPase subunit
MTEITSRIATVVAGLVAVVLAVACTVQLFELRSVRSDYALAQQKAQTDDQSIGTLRSQLATSQADLAQAASGVQACSASVAQAASEASAVRAAATAAKAKAATQAQAYQQQIDALSKRIQDPSNQSETCDAAFDRLRGAL